MEALKLQSDNETLWILIGFVAAIVLLVVIAQGIFYLGKKLPFNLFFSVSGHLLYLLATIFIGQGMHMWCQALGIRSSKEGGITGYQVPQFFNEKRYEEIARYCFEDIRATSELFDVWNRFINIK
jgi:uncharacterized membrane protein